tara:strand:- start:34 stop:309 length:276 start_codon:yes stop_codon:yes gene_type:complete
MMIFNRNIFLIISLSFLLFSYNETAAIKIKAEGISNSQVQPSYGEITFDRIFHDFGNVNEGKIAETTFAFTNTPDGSQLLRIQAFVKSKNN